MFRFSSGPLDVCVCVIEWPRWTSWRQEVVRGGLEDPSHTERCEKKMLPFWTVVLRLPFQANTEKGTPVRWTKTTLRSVGRHSLRRILNPVEHISRLATCVCVCV